MAEILPIRRKTQSNNHLKNHNILEEDVKQQTNKRKFSILP